MPKFHVILIMTHLILWRQMGKYGRLADIYERLLISIGATPTSDIVGELTALYHTLRVLAAVAREHAALTEVIVWPLKL